MPPQIIPEDYNLVRYKILDETKIKTIKESELPSAWRHKIYDLSVFQEFGRKRLFDKNLLGLYIHSSVAYPSHNYVLNPKHPEFRDSIQISEIKPYVFDLRLVQLFKTGIR